MCEFEPLRFAYEYLPFGLSLGMFEKCTDLPSQQAVSLPCLRHRLALSQTQRLSNRTQGCWVP